MYFIKYGNLVWVQLSRELPETLFNQESSWVDSLLGTLPDNLHPICGVHIPIIQQNTHIYPANYFLYIDLNGKIYFTQKGGQNNIPSNHGSWMWVRGNGIYIVDN